MKYDHVAIDFSSIAWTSLRTGKDKEGYEIEYEGKKQWINTAAYAYEFAVESINAALRDFSCVPRQLILVQEGMSPKKYRLFISQAYKASRGSKSSEEMVEFEKLKQMLEHAYLNLGAIKVSQDNVEGDDVLAWLAKNAEFNLGISTFDNDLMVLHGTNERGYQVSVRIKGEVGYNKYGPFDHRLITLYKSLVGDTSDNIKGCPGFGEKAFQTLFAEFGEEGMFELLGLLESGSLSALNGMHGKHKLVTKILDSSQEVLTSYGLAKLHPEWVDTIGDQLTWQGGMVNAVVTDERLRMFNQKKRLVTTDNLLEAYNFLQSKLAETEEFSFDIETSPVPESEEWMAAQGRPDGVDVLGHRLTGFSITFGRNNQYTYYVTVNHRDAKNISLTDARLLLELMFSAGKHVVIQNTSFEGAVLATEEDEGKTWTEHWKDNGYRGFIPRWLDTVFEASYVNENEKLGLKERSKMHLGYEQQTFMDTVCKTGFVKDPDAASPLDEQYKKLPQGGRIVKVLEWEAFQDEEGEAKQRPLVVTKQYNMNELTADEVFDYGCDDTICTIALHNLYKLIMKLEHTWDVYLKVEIDASYQHVKNFLDGKSFSLEKMNELKAEDDATFDKAWGTIRDYLIANGWEGTKPPVYGTDITVKQMKEAYAIVNGLDGEDDEEPDEEDLSAVRVAEEKAKDPILSSRVRTPAKIPALMRSHGADEQFVLALEACMASEAGAAAFTRAVQSKFDGEPKFKVSNRQMKRLLYEVMQLPQEVFNKPTATMRKQGIRQGTVKTDALAIKYALRSANDEQKAILEALQLYQMVKTRRGLYYSTYPYFVHWKTGKIHSYHRQCSTNTRRASSAMPNEQQMPKHAKIEGQTARFRETIVPHKPGAVVVSLDESQQEIRLLAFLSRDEALLSCYTGPLENERDVHSLTGIKILAKRRPDVGSLSYDEYRKHLKDKESPLNEEVKKTRTLAKPVNFGDQYMAMAEKIGQLLMVPTEEAQEYLDAKSEAFPDVGPWKQRAITEAKELGYTTTLLGARRHLAGLFNSDDFSARNKAERQVISFRIQGSGAEMLKLAEGRMWAKGLAYKYDAVCYGSIHDEVVWSVNANDLMAFLEECHSCMVAPYGGMDVNIVSEISFGNNFGEQWEAGAGPDATKVAEGLKELAEERATV